VHGSLKTQVVRFYLNYRITPQTTTGVSSSKLLFGHWLSAVTWTFYTQTWDFKVHQSQSRQKEFHDFHTRDCTLPEGDTVLTKNFSTGEPESEDI